MASKESPQSGPRPPLPLSLAEVRTAPYATRRHLVSVERFATTPLPADGVGAFVDSLPGILAGQAFRNLVGHVAAARRGGRGVVVALGAHVIKCGLSPVLIDLMRRGVVTGLALNGAGAIHDFEVAFGGQTSEDVEEGLEDGAFGMAQETGEALAEAASRGVREQCGLGRALGLSILEADLPYRRQSLLAAAAELGRPATVHVAIGTDTVHMHPNALGAAIGESSHLDFRIACGVAAHLAGGVWINVGSAVLLPEVFLKCVTVAHNLGHSLDGLVTANFDMIRQYRAQTNVVDRPSAVGISLIGQHELLLPLFRMAVLVALEDGRPAESAPPARMGSDPNEKTSRGLTPFSPASAEAGLALAPEPAQATDDDGPSAADALFLADEPAHEERDER
jgi:hypothetical protein